MPVAAPPSGTGERARRTPRLPRALASFAAAATLSAVAACGDDGATDPTRRVEGIYQLAIVEFENEQGGIPALIATAPATDGGTILVRLQSGSLDLDDGSFALEYLLQFEGADEPDRPVTITGDYEVDGEIIDFIVAGDSNQGTIEEDGSIVVPGLVLIAEAPHLAYDLTFER